MKTSVKWLNICLNKLIAFINLNLDIVWLVVLPLTLKLWLAQQSWNIYQKLEDDLAQAFCLVGELQPTKDHCKASIKILEKLYDLNHIFIGNEMVKLTSIQLALGEAAAIDSINRMDAIFSRYYGSHTNIIFPHLQCHKREEAFKLIE